MVPVGLLMWAGGTGKEGNPHGADLGAKHDNTIRNVDDQLAQLIIVVDALVRPNDRTTNNMIRLPQLTASSATTVAS